MKGLEADVSLRPVSAIGLTGGISILDKSLTQNTFVPPANWTVVLGPPGTPPTYVGPTPDAFAAGVFYGAPDFSYNAAIHLTVPTSASFGELTLHAKVSGSGTVKYETITVPPTAELDLRADWRDVLGSNVDLSVFATNVTNKTSVAGPGISSSGFAFNTVFYNEPRMFGVQLHYEFGQ